MDEKKYLKQENGHGIKRIVDCKVENGRQMYKVKWEATWEPAENLVMCHNLVDEFWSRINHLKYKESKSAQEKKEIKLENVPEIESYSLSTDFKSNVNSLITRTVATSSNDDLVPPSSYLLSSQIKKQDILQSLDNNKSKNLSSKVNNSSTDFSSKPSNNTCGSTASFLRQIKSFEHPYVKALFVCKICNKDQTEARTTSHWKMHYLTHSEEKPFNCPHCSRGFIRADKLRNHVNSRHNDIVIKDQV